MSHTEMLASAWQTAKVSIDVSTCDADADRRVFGRVVDWQPEDYDGEKPLGLRLLCEYESDNFGLRAAPPPAGADAVRIQMIEQEASVLWNLMLIEREAGHTQGTWTIIRDCVLRLRSVLPAPQPQPQGDQK